MGTEVATTPRKKRKRRTAAQAQCPACGSWNTFQTSTRRLVRWMECADCGHTFKAARRDYAPPA